MTQRQITECDRCHREIKGVSRSLTRGDPHGRSNPIGDTNFDLCEGCDTKLSKFLDGANLEVPP